MTKFFSLLSILLSIGFAAGAQAKVVWDVGSQSNQISCFPADDEGQTIPNSFGVDPRFCYHEFGVEWALSTRNLMICVPVMPNFPDASRNEIDANYCYRKYGGEWAHGDDGYTHCYPLYPGFSTGTRYPIDDGYCAN